MSAPLSTTESVKQNARRLGAKASDKMKLASSAVARGETRAMDVAIIKATTSQFHVVPKEKHVRALKSLLQTSGNQGQSEILRELLKRLRSATDWLTALKTLMVFHRLMHDCGPQCLNELAAQEKFDSALKGKNGGVLDMTNFLDTTNIDGRFDYSEWVRAYGRYLDETLDVWRNLKFIAGRDNVGEVFSLRQLSGSELLRQLPILQKLQQRLMDCRPGGAARTDPVVQASLFAVLKESFRIYKAVSEGIINLADKFFDMEYLEAQKGLEIYKESIVDNAKLQDYYVDMQKLEELRSLIQFPKLESLPADFLTQMEEYVREAPRVVSSTEKVAAKKHSPLRKGSKTSAQAAKPALKFSQSTSTEASVAAPQAVAIDEPNGTASGQSRALELNLMDMEELSLADSSAPNSLQPAHNSTENSGSDVNLYLEALMSPSASEYTSSATTPAPWPGASPQIYPGQQKADSAFSTPGQSPFWPVPQQGHTSGFRTADPFQASLQGAQSSNFANNNTASTSAPFGQQANLPHAPPRHQGTPASFNVPRSLAGFSMPPNPQQQNGFFGGGLASPSPVGQNGGFSTRSQPESHSTSASDQIFGTGVLGRGPVTKTAGAPPSIAPSIAAGLTAPQNATLAKDVALHDPFADLGPIQQVPQRKAPALRSSRPAH